MGKRCVVRHPELWRYRERVLSAVHPRLLSLWLK